MKKQVTPLISVVMGSDSDFPVMSETIKILEDFKLPHEVFITSAHRSPERTSSFAKKASERGIKVIIVGAGAAAHLAGVIASQSLLPVIGVPIDATALGGIDALLSIAQMPGGVPVATMAVGKAGAKNAALLAIRILSVEDGNLRKKLDRFVRDMARDVEKKQEDLLCRKS
ncbi:MAG: 5-(carboxyamino)imidazole ribonucleotide mutase [Deltaproteobacteria bacterium]|nr:5-(carboxyamino)imidazole ribonucleotide mutase [Deltaproteobacteria bacterium]